MKELLVLNPTSLWPASPVRPEGNWRMNWCFSPGRAGGAGNLPRRDSEAGGRSLQARECSASRRGAESGIRSGLCTEVPRDPVWTRMGGGGVGGAGPALRCGFGVSATEGPARASALLTSLTCTVKAVAADLGAPEGAGGQVLPELGWVPPPHPSTSLGVCVRACACDTPARTGAQ